MLVPAKFIVSAPGKVILFGEHSVVFGKPVLAASINRRTSLFFKTTVSDFIEMKFSTMDLSTSIPVEIFTKSGPLIGTDSLKHLSHDELLKTAEMDIEKLDDYPNFNRNQCLSVRCVFYLIHGLFGGKNKLGSFKMNISTDLTIGAGTGSSASFSVCLAAALYHYSRILNSNGEDVEKLKELSEKDKESINEWAFACEQIIHGKASGIDNTVCTYGRVVRMSFNHGDGCRKMNVLDDITSLRILLVNTGVNRNTADMIKKVADRHLKHPTVVDLILEAISEIVNSACSALKQLSLEQSTSDSNVFRELYSKLECLLSLNQGLLVSLGVSHEDLDNIINVTKKFNLYSKLTGAGGGGYAFTLIPPFTPEECVQNCVKALEDGGYTVDDIIVGTGGIDIKFL